MQQNILLLKHQIKECLVSIKRLSEDYNKEVQLALSTINKADAGPIESEALKT
jgi:hypothetical protein